MTLRRQEEGLTVISGIGAKKKRRSTGTQKDATPPTGILEEHPARQPKTNHAANSPHSLGEVKPDLATSRWTADGGSGVLNQAPTTNTLPQKPPEDRLIRKARRGGIRLPERPRPLMDVIVCHRG